MKNNNNIPSISSREKMSKAKLGKKHPRYKGFYSIDGKKYYSAAQAEVATGINKRTILRWCHNPKIKWLTFVIDSEKKF